MHSSIFSIIYRWQVINIDSAVLLSIFFTLHAIIAAVSQFLLFVSITLTGLVLEINMQRQSKHACIIWWEKHACRRF